jgi:hypothetical protein
VQPQHPNNRDSQKYLPWRSGMAAQPLPSVLDANREAVLAHRIDQTKDRRVSTDPEAEDEDRRNCEAWRFEELAASALFQLIPKRF